MKKKVKLIVSHVRIRKGPRQGRTFVKLGIQLCHKVFPFSSTQLKMCTWGGPRSHKLCIYILGFLTQMIFRSVAFPSTIQTWRFLHRLDKNSHFVQGGVNLPQKNSLFEFILEFILLVVFLLICRHHIFVLLSSASAATNPSSPRRLLVLLRTNNQI